MRFKQITILDKTRLTEKGISNLQNYSEQPVVSFSNCPADEFETIERIAESDCILVSWMTPVTETILKQVPKLRYIGMCCSLYDPASSNVDVLAAERFGITVKAVRDYGDEGVVELIFAQLIILFKGIGNKKWKSQPTELSSKSIGIIGLGTLGKMIAATAKNFGMDIYYTGRTEKPEAETLGAKMLPLEELLESCDIITIHIPRNSLVLTKNNFSFKKKKSILINTSLGQPFEEKALFEWLANDPDSLAIFDSDGAGKLYDKLSTLNNVILYPISAGFTEESGMRLTEKVTKNIEEHFAES